MQGIWVWFLVWEDSPCYGATEPVCGNYRACALEPVLHNKRSHNAEKPVHGNGDEKPVHGNGDEKPVHGKGDEKPVHANGE